MDQYFEKSEETLALLKKFLLDLLEYLEVIT